MVRYEIEQHAVAFPTKLLAQNGGKHIYNVQLETDTDNGNLIARGDWIELDLYKEAAVTSFSGIVRDKAANGHFYVEVVDPGDALFVYNVPRISEEWTNTWKKESNYFNGADEVARSYELAVGDIFEVSVEGFTATPEIGATVSGVAGKKLTI